MTDSKRFQIGQYIKNFNYIQFISDHGITIAFIAILVILSFASPNFLKAANLINILRQVSCIGIATLGVGILIIMGQIDLAIGSTFALSGIVAGLAVSSGTGGLGLHPIIGYIAGIGVSLIVAYLSGLVVAKARIPAFIVTMGTMSIGRGLALILLMVCRSETFQTGLPILGPSPSDRYRGPLPFLS